MAGPLNPDLYRRLVDEFGQVLIANEGESMILSSLVDTSWKATKLRDGSAGCDRPRGRKVSHPGEYYRVACFAGDTQVMTPCGDAAIKDLVGVSKLLVPNRRGLGSWKDVEVKSFGPSPLLTVKLRRDKNVKFIRATPSHRWILSVRGKKKAKCPYQAKPVTTVDLRPGDRLSSCSARVMESYANRPRPSRFAVCQGFVFGDGSVEKQSSRPAYVDIFKPKEKDLLPYFKNCRTEYVPVRDTRVPRVMDLPRTWKSLPSLDESLSFLMGWLSGYFSADGHVYTSGTRATLESSVRENLEFAKAVLYRLGVRPSPIKRHVHWALGKRRVIFRLPFGTRELPAEFWIREKHKNRAASSRKRVRPSRTRDWVVEYVHDEGESEEVFCAVVPDIEMFTLADNLLTMNCPVCQDHKPRLWINHRAPEFPMLMVCYNANCYDSRIARDALIFRLFKTRRPLKPIIMPGRVDSGRIERVDFPGPVVRLDELPLSHPACDYLGTERGYDPHEIGRVYGASYCERSAKYPAASNRIVIPIYMGGKMVGWQARFIGERNWKKSSSPKYYNLPRVPRNRMLYNYDNAKKHPWVVIQEGITDVWSTGPFAMALLGKTVTFAHRTMLSGNPFVDKPLAIMLDADAQLDNEATTDLLRKEHKGPVFMVTVPDGADPGSMSPETNMRLILAAADAAGVRLPEAVGL